jgi:hypothetical protein
MNHAHESNAHKSNPNHDLRPIVARSYIFDLNGMIHYPAGFSFVFWAFLLPILARLVEDRVDYVDDSLSGLIPGAVGSVNQFHCSGLARIIHK